MLLAWHEALEGKENRVVVAGWKRDERNDDGHFLGRVWLHGRIPYNPLTKDRTRSDTTRGNQKIILIFFSNRHPGP